VLANTFYVLTQTVVCFTTFCYLIVVILSYYSLFYCYVIDVYV
jgi:hypothetical protein